MTAEYEMKKQFSPNLYGTGSLKIGAKSDVTKGWEIISNTGQGIFDIYLSPSVMLSLQKTLETGKKYDDGICSSKLGLRKGGRIYLGSIPLGKAAAALPGGQIITAATNINIPVCLPVNVSSDMKYDLLELSGKLQTKIVVGNKTSPQITNQNSLKIESPPISATLSEGKLEGNKKYSVKVQGEAGLEAGLEIEDKIGKIANVGANIAILVKPELQGTFGVGLVSKKLSALDTEPEVCLELKVKADLQSKVFASSLGNDPLTIVASFPLKEIAKKYGQCRDEGNDVSGDVSLNSATCNFITHEEVVTHLPKGGEIITPKNDFYTYDISGSFVLNQVVENISTLKFYRYPLGYSVTPIVIGADGKKCIRQNWTGDIDNYSEIPTVIQQQPLPPFNTQWRIKGSFGNPSADWSAALDCKSPSIFQGLSIDFVGGDKPTDGKDNIAINIPCPQKSKF
ncbi:hypothetical protein [Acinetobacter proteolyticus]|nr:hypothetical protein [Acinetobacter proteolyticus]